MLWMSALFAGVAWLVELVAGLVELVELVAGLVELVEAVELGRGGRTHGRPSHGLGLVARAGRWHGSHG